MTAPSISPAKLSVRTPITSPVIEDSPIAVPIEKNSPTATPIVEDSPIVAPDFSPVMPPVPSISPSLLAVINNLGMQKDSGAMGNMAMMKGMGMKDPKFNKMMMMMMMKMSGFKEKDRFRG
jgi:hypothetical protein